MTQAHLAEAFDLGHLPPSFHEDPYPFYDALRTHAPVKRLRNGHLLLTRYADCLQAYRDPAFSADKHVRAIGAVLAADAIGTLFNRYTDLPGAADRAAFALALVAEVVMGRAAANVA